MPLPSTMTPIATNTLSSAASSITFSNIPQTYKDLVFVLNGYFSVTTYGYFRINSDTSSNYSYTRIVGYSGGVLSDRSSVSDGISIGNTSSGIWTADFMDYSNTNIYKTILAREQQSSTAMAQYVYLYRSKSAINSISIYGQGGNNFVAGTIATIYGIKAAS